MYLNSILLLICIFASTGCTSTTVLSDNQVFSGQINTHQKIKRPALLMSGNKPWEEVKDGEESYFYGAPYILYDKKLGSNSWRETGWVPIGTDVVITEITYFKEFTHNSIKAVGLIYLPEVGPKKFIYFWQELRSCSSVRRAPWESNETPKIRHIEEIGC